MYYSAFLIIHDVVDCKRSRLCYIRICILGSVHNRCTFCRLRIPASVLVAGIRCRLQNVTERFCLRCPRSVVVLRSQFIVLGYLLTVVPERSVHYCVGYHGLVFIRHVVRFVRILGIIRILLIQTVNQGDHYIVFHGSAYGSTCHAVKHIGFSIIDNFRQNLSAQVILCIIRGGPIVLVVYYSAFLIIHDVVDCKCFRNWPPARGKCQISSRPLFNDNIHGGMITGYINLACIICPSSKLITFLTRVFERNVRRPHRIGDRIRIRPFCTAPDCHISHTFVGNGIYIRVQGKFNDVLVSIWYELHILEGFIKAVALRLKRLDCIFIRCATEIRCFRNTPLILSISISCNGFTLICIPYLILQLCRCRIIKRDHIVTRSSL